MTLRIATARQPSSVGILRILLSIGRRERKPQAGGSTQRRGSCFNRENSPAVVVSRQVGRFPCSANPGSRATSTGSGCGRKVNELTIRCSRLHPSPPYL